MVVIFVPQVASQPRPVNPGELSAKSYQENVFIQQFVAAYLLYRGWDSPI